MTKSVRSSIHAVLAAFALATASIGAQGPAAQAPAQPPAAAAPDGLRARLPAPPSPGRPAPAAALPMITFRGPVTFHMNGEDVQLIPVPVAHTDGDTMVRFPGVDVIMTGDFYRSVGYPNIDRANGGSLKGMLEGFTALINLAGPGTKIIPGHGAVVDKGGVAAHRDMAMAMRERVGGLARQG